jgi:hypothetical protein
MKVDVKPIEEGATPDPNNINRHTQKGGGLLENSLRRRGAFRSIASAGKGVDVPVVMAGNFTLEKAIDAGFTEIVNVHVTGNQLVNVVRDDLEPGSAEAIALGLEDNEIGKQSYNPDLDILAAVMADPAMQALKAEDKILADIVEGMGKAVTGMDGFDFGGLPDQDRAPFRQVTFTLHDSQYEVVAEALKASKAMGAFVDSPNENSNGNAIARICETFLTQNDNS